MIYFPQVFNHTNSKLIQDLSYCNENLLHQLQVQRNYNHKDIKLVLTHDKKTKEWKST